MELFGIKGARILGINSLWWNRICVGVAGVGGVGVGVGVGVGGGQGRGASHCIDYRNYSK